MKKLFTLIVLAFICVNLNAASMSGNWAQNFGDNPEIKALTPEMVQMGMENFLTLTPKKYKEMTGKRLGIKKALQLKAAQKIVKRQMKGGASDIPKGLYIVLAILGWAWLVMGIMDNWEGKNWWVNLILVILCWLPGVIHALVKMNEYYGGGGKN